MAPTAQNTRAPLTFRPPAVEDGPALWALARQAGLDENSPYAYLLWAEYFTDTTILAVDPVGGDPNDHIVGFVTAFRPPTDPDCVFVWQIGVAGTHRRQGIAGRLLDELVERTGAGALEATVTPSNAASETLFRRFADRHAASVRTEELFGADLFPPGHEAELRFRIEPLAP